MHSGGALLQTCSGSPGTVSLAAAPGVFVGRPAGRRCRAPRQRPLLPAVATGLHPGRTGQRGVSGCPRWSAARLVIATASRRRLGGTGWPSAPHILFQETPPYGRHSRMTVRIPREGQSINQQPGDPQVPPERGPGCRPSCSSQPSAAARSTRCNPPLRVDETHGGVGACRCPTPWPRAMRS